MADTSIEWTERTWNPIVGCSLASPGCTNCYAMKMAGRLEAMGVECYRGTTQKTKAGFVWTGKIATNDNALMEPLRRRAPTMWFVNSMSDLFHEDVSEQAIDRIFVVMALRPQHTFQMLTKRADRMRAYVEGFNWQRAVENCRDAAGSSLILKHSIADLRRKFGLAQRFSYDQDCSVWPLPNVWKGVSVEDQKRADERIPDLLATPAAIRWLSCEPLLGTVRLDRIHQTFDDGLGHSWESCLNGKRFNEWGGSDGEGGDVDGCPKVDWVICGGESGARARPMHPDWARSLRDQCADNGVPFFFKQWGDWAPHVAVGNEHGGIDMVPPVSFKAAHRWRRWDHGRSRVARADESVSEFLAPGVISVPVGKKAAGRLLDGVQHDGVPA
jgi:protein gp37